MGLFDRLFGSRSDSAEGASSTPQEKPAQEEQTFFLDPDASTSLGDLKFMRRSNQIRRTFPGNADSPGEKEMVADVASMEARVETMTPGLAGLQQESEDAVKLNAGVPKQVKKTFAQQISPAELGQRLKGSAVTGANVPGGPAAAKKRQEEISQSQPQVSPKQPAKPGDTDPFRSMVRDLDL